eukprot:TRINITY_DN839_c0_g1_i26.p1 TRINITY_DN839_c0_g1~~TRINITY_DN839_c0_g1_i26.p1  ORF type:complete len:831 (-),score=158.18 TRINITY_DN839_c0_g1_i26:70-2562(-)
MLNTSDNSDSEQDNRPELVSCPHIQSINYGYLQQRFGEHKWKELVRTKMIRCKEDECKVISPYTWACLGENCAHIGCGRDQNQHAQHHATDKTHPLCINTTTLVIWCYLCDNEILEADLQVEQHAALVSFIRDLVKRSIETKEPTSSGSNTPNGNNSNNSNGNHLNNSNNSVKGKGNAKNKHQGLCGMDNLGNTCYLNSAIQCLSNCPPLTRFFLKCDLPPNIANIRRTKLSVSFQVLLRHLWSGNYQYIRPVDFVRDIFDLFPIFRGYGQQDSQELLMEVLSRLHDELKYEIPPQQRIESKPTETNATQTPTQTTQTTQTTQSQSSESTQSQPSTQPPQTQTAQTPQLKNSQGSQNTQNSSNAPPKQFKSIISDIFEGALLSKAKCLNCGKTSPTRDKSWNLTVSIPTKKIVRPDDKNAQKEKSKQSWFSSVTDFVGITSRTVSLEDCLYSFCSVEGLTGQDQYRCEFCKALHDSEKCLSIVSLPEILVIHIKRFRYDSYFANKLSNHVAFPLEGLDMSPFCAAPGDLDATKDNVNSVGHLYDLIGIISHSGVLGGGHYVSYAKHKRTKKWHNFNDNYVSEIPEQEILNVQAYVLFYHRRIPKRLEEERKRVKELRAHSSVEVCISKDWWNKFKTLSDPGKIDHSKFVCRHGNVKRWAGKGGIEHQLKVISQEAYDFLISRYGGGPQITPSYENALTCIQCRKEEESLIERRAAEKEAINARDRSNLLPGEYWCLIDTHWVEKWKEFVFSEATDTPPGPISNSRLLDPVTGKPRPHLSRGGDYRGVILAIWDYFHSIYGGGPLIARQTLDIYDTPLLIKTDIEKPKENS